MIHRFFPVILLLLFTLAGCAYYNTLHHAKQFYKEAETARAKVSEDKRSSVGLNLYEKSMKKCAKVIIEYPDSRWVDDAILLMGKCFYAKGDYLAALRKFDELLVYYEKSNLISEARFYKAKTLVDLERYEEAVPVLQEFREAGKGEWRKQAQYLLALVQYRVEDYASATEGFESYYSQNSGAENRDEVLAYLGDAYSRSGDHDKAYHAYETMLENPMLDSGIRFRRSLDMADALVNQGRFEDAYAALEDIRAETRDDKDSLKIDYSHAIAMEKEGKIEEVVAFLQAGLVDPPSCEEAGNMAYMLGRIYLNEFDNRDSAAAAFRKVVQYPAEKSKKEEAARTSAFLSDNIRLQAEYEEEGADTARIEFMLAENEYFFFDRPVAAFARYRLVSVDFPESPYAPAALAAQIYLHDRENDVSSNRDSLLMELARRYPVSVPAAEYIDRGEVEVDPESLAVWVALYREAHPEVDTTVVDSTGGGDEVAVEEVVEGMHFLDSSNEIFPVGPPAPLRILARVEPTDPLLPEGMDSVHGEAEVEVEVSGEGRILSARIVRSDNPVLEGPALAAAYQCRYVPEAIVEPRITSLTFTFR